jgi:hypothetical protein
MGKRDPKQINPSEKCPDDLAALGDVDTQPLAAAAVMAVREMANDRIREERARHDRAPDREMTNFCLEIISRLRGI